MNPLQKTLAELLSAAGFAGGDIEVCEGPNKESVRLNIQTEDSGLLIGKNGEVLTALNHIFKNILLTRAPETKIPPSIDINNYRLKQEEDIKAKAFMLAERARFFKRDIELDPMNAYDRMLVHSAFTDIRDIETESKGVGRERRIVLKYRALSETEEPISSVKEKTTSFRI